MTARASGPATESATERLSRLLTMVPWLLNQQGVEIGRGGRGVRGVNERQLEGPRAAVRLRHRPATCPTT